MLLARHHIASCYMVTGVGSIVWPHFKQLHLLALTLLGQKSGLSGLSILSDLSRLPDLQQSQKKARSIY